MRLRGISHTKDTMSIVLPTFICIRDFYFLSHNTATKDVMIDLQNGITRN